MKTLHVYRTYFPDTQGGLEEVIRQICHTTAGFDIDSRVFTLSEMPHPQVVTFDGVEVFRFKKTFEVASCGVSFGSLGGFKRLVDWADIVHYHFPWPFGDLLHLLARVNKPSLVTYHSDVVRQKGLLKLYRPLMKYFLNEMDCIVSTSQNYFATSDVLGHYAEKVEVIPIGLDDDTYPEVNDGLVEKIRGSVGEGFFLFIGVLRYYKGLHILLDAIRDTNLRVVIVGAGPVESELRQHAQRLDLHNVRFMGYVGDDVKVALIKLSRAIVFPSYLRSEAFGVTLLEGAMYGKPLISTEIGTGTSYINKHEVTGYVVPPADPKRLRKAMQKLANDKELAERLGQAARRRYEKHFTGELMGKRYARLYKRLLDK